MGGGGGRARQECSPKSATAKAVKIKTFWARRGEGRPWLPLHPPLKVATNGNQGKSLMDVQYFEAHLHKHHPCTEH